MCRSIENHGISHKENERLKIRAFYLRLSASNAETALPDTLSLVYLPRMTGSLLEINDAKIRPDSAALVALHRVRSAEKRVESGGLVEAVFTSTDRVRASEGVRFEVYLKEEKVLKGIFRKDEDEMWKVECRCVATEGGLGVSEAEVCVAGERCGMMKERVEMVVRKKRRGFEGLEEIPEETETESDGCDCEEMEVGSSDGGDYEEDEREEDETVEMEMEGVRWAVDLGIWVMCLGVGILVSRASTKGLMRRRGRKLI
ncbi:uncharacterized protein LOC131248575 [Magnolia sinica]|uniref:uncharacterized protein LOC131248575 n=1 Tax=Magnolia sinica TaxID=86752 RepID=UPI002658D48B|nr:uncharacterized protein LOC131248575 [Magnolia sinica]